MRQLRLHYLERQDSTIQRIACGTSEDKVGLLAQGFLDYIIFSSIAPETVATKGKCAALRPYFDTWALFVALPCSLYPEVVAHLFPAKKTGPKSKQ